HGDTVLALWVVLTYLMDEVDVAAILGLTSPVKRCGKTLVMDMLTRLAHRPLATSNVSPAALFRVIDRYSPTLLCDEGETFLRDNEGLRGILNAGHTRATAYVLRAVGEEFEPRRFSTWGAKAIALIGTLPDTLADRSVEVRLERRKRDEKIERLRDSDPEEWR